MVVISHNVSLKELNTFAVDAKSKYFATFNNDAELLEILQYCGQNDIEWFVLGCGANVIFCEDFEGMVIHPTSLDIAFEGDNIVADAGVEWDEFVAFCVGAGYYGVENLSLIPSSIGAAPVQNIGAYGAEVKDKLEWVEYMDVQSLEIVRLTKEQCKFGYRESVFKKELKGKAIIVRVAFKMEKKGELKMDYGDVKERVKQLGQPSLKNIRQAIIEIRSSKLPDVKELPNAGSFFKNPVVNVEFADQLAQEYQNMPKYVVDCGVKLAAGWLIEQAGWKGRQVGKMAVHSRQALVLVNVAGASGREILEFSQMIIDDVQAKFGVTLEREVNVV